MQEKRNITNELRTMTELHEKHVDNSKDNEKKLEQMARDLENHRNLCQKYRMDILEQEQKHNETKIEMRKALAEKRELA